MHVLYFSTNPSLQSGSTRCLLQIVKGLLNEIRLSVILPTDNQAAALFERAGIQPTEIDVEQVRASFHPVIALKSAFKAIGTVRQLSEYIEQNHVDIIHVNEIMDLHAALAAKLNKRKLVWHVRADIENPVLRLLSRTLITLLSDVIIVPSNSVAQRMFRGESSCRHSIRVIHDVAVDTDSFNPYASGDTIVQELNLQGAFPVVGLVSKLKRKKGHEWLIQAASEVRKQFPKARFLIVGGPVANHEEEAIFLKYLVQRHQLDGTVTMLGMREDVHSIMAGCDIIVHFPAYPDPFPGVVLEAMALGKPCICSQIGGIPEQIEDGLSGKLVRARDSGRLAGAITELAENDGLRKQLGREARKRFETEFSLNASLSQILDVYSALI
jgi:glycosyltransferase involved in cell wall biosynthesis